MTTYINLSQADGERLNQIMFYGYCFNQQTNEWIFPFSEGTTSYYDFNQSPWVVDDNLLNAPTNPLIAPADQQWIENSVLPTQLTYDQAVAAGWIIPPPPPTGG